MQIGLRNEALNSRSFWLCTNCFSCTIRCPRGIALTETMAALKRLAIAENVKHKEKQDISSFYRAFMTTIRRRGRNHEAEMLMRYFFSTSPLGLVGYARLGLAMFRRGRVPLLSRGVRDMGEIEALFRKTLAVEAAKEART